MRRMKKMPKEIYQIGYTGYHALNYLFGNMKQWDKKISFS